MNSLDVAIKNYLEKSFNIKFIVEKIGGYEFLIRPENDYKELFKITATLNDSSRLSIICQPDDYGTVFLNNINYSEKEKRQTFCDYWKKLGSQYLAVFINGNEYTFDSFVDNKDDWERFEIKYSKVPYYDDDSSDEDKKNIILDTISLICGMILSIADYTVTGIMEYGFEEGKVYHQISKKYERNPINRKICLANKGYKCSVCGMDFESIYGEIGKDFIHVHHINPVHLMGENYIVDPILELYPVCPNCHNMLHRKDPPYSIEELKRMIEEKRKEGDNPNEY